MLPEAFKSNTFREGQYFSSDNAEYSMLILVLLFASKLYTHTSSKLRWKNITYTYMKIYAKKSQGNWKKVYGQTVSPRSTWKAKGKADWWNSIPFSWLSSAVFIYLTDVKDNKSLFVSLEPFHKAIFKPQWYYLFAFWTLQSC